MSALIVYVALLAFFLALAVFFSAAETAFMAVNRVRLRYQAKTGDRRAEAVERVVSNPDRLLGVILLGVTVSEIAAASLLTFLIATHMPREQLDWASLAGSVILALVVLIFCELAPKIIAATSATKPRASSFCPLESRSGSYTLLPGW